MTAPHEDHWEPPRDRGFIDIWESLKADMAPYVAEIKASVLEIVDALRPEDDPPICRQEVPPEGQE